MDESENPVIEEEEVEEVPQEIEIVPIAGIGTLVFGRWDASEVTVQDPGLVDYINLVSVGTPHSGGRHANTWFGKLKLSLFERFINNLMRSEKYTGKKAAATIAFEEALAQIEEKTNSNPLQIFVDGVCNAAPMEEVTRIQFGGATAPKAVDSSPSRRLDVAVRFLAKGAVQSAAKSTRSLTDCIVSEILGASRDDVSSAAIRHKNDVENQASSAR